MMIQKRKIYYLLGCALLSLLVFGGITIFAVRNNGRIASTGRSYLYDKTSQTAERLDDAINEGLGNIRVLAQLVSNSLTSPEFDIAGVQDLIKNSVFDFMEFADVNGMDHNITGGVSDARDRKYYLDAKAGNIGMELIHVSRATHETLLMFYAPVYYQSEFVGSLVGVYQASNRITRLLSSEYFGQAGLSFLTTSEGRVIASSDSFDPTHETYLTDLFVEDAATSQTLQEGLSNEVSFFSLPDQPVGGCMVKLPRQNFFLVQEFPKIAANKLISDSNSLAYQLTVFLFIVYVIFAFVIVKILKNRQALIKKAKDEAELAMHEAEAANDAKTSFLFNMSHDIRTPMNAIRGFRDLLDKYQEDPVRRKDYLAKIDEASSVLLSIINNVLEMARIEKGTIVVEESPWSVEQFNDAIFSIFHEMMLQKHITFTRVIEVEHHFVFCDPIKLREIFYNILSNAYKYTDPGGKVHMHLKEIPSDREGWACFQTVITDTGIGMSQDFLPHLFEEFSREHTTTESKTEGTGLGMPIVKRLVELMEGTIRVESELGVGSKFIVTISHKITDKAECKRIDSSVLVGVDFSGKRVLIAEDNELNAEISLEVLDELGFESVDRAVDGKQAVEMLEQADDDYYSIVLMDIQMPHMNGYEATRAIRCMQNNAKATIPVLAMTANAFEEDRRNAIQAGMNGHIAKPIDINELKKMLAFFCR
ncbi:MAG: response regulator [Bacteroidales bacterium]|nr:response regulator [Bacteroidales bacterium]